jgi:nucleoside phosphorylase
MIVVSACFRAETAWIPKVAGVRVVYTAMGENAVVSFEKALTVLGRPALLLSTGFCGGIDPSLHAGGLVLAETIRHCGETVTIDRALLQRVQDTLLQAKFDVRCGSVQGTEQIVRSAEEKRRLWDERMIAVDMESGPLARWASRHRVKFLSLRAVLDPADWSLPAEIGNGTLLLMYRHPWATLRLFFRSVLAGRALGQAIPAVIGALQGDVR